MKAATVKILFAVSVLLLCAGFFAGCSDPFTETGLTGARSLMDQRSRTQILSEMTEKECVEFIISKGVVIPDEFVDHPQLGAFVKSDIKAAELNPNIPPAYSWGVSYKFAESIRVAVNGYYGTSRSYSASTRSTHILKDSKVLTKNGDWGSSGGYWHYDWSGYNCYSYSIGKVEKWYEPGNFANTGCFTLSISIYDLALVVKADLEKLTSSPVQITNIAPNTSTLQPQQKLICVRRGAKDYHFMRYIKNNGWYHKPGEYAPMKFNYKTTDIDWTKTWTDERSANGSEYAAEYFYDNDIYYIIYNDWNPQTTVTADTIPLRAPVAGRSPQTRVVTHQYTGTVTWVNSYGTPLGSNQTFAAGTAYTAVINLDAAINFTLQGLPSNFFTVFGAASTSFNDAVGVLTVVFPPAKTAVGDFDVLLKGLESDSTSKEGPIGIFTLYTDNTWTLEEVGFYSYYLDSLYKFDPNPNVEHRLSWNVPMSITGYLAQVDMTANVELTVKFPVRPQGGLKYVEYALVLEVSSDGAKIIWRDQTVNDLLSFDSGDFRYMPAVAVPVSGSLIPAPVLGNGTAHAPYQIVNAAKLLNIYKLDSATTYFELSKDIDLSVVGNALPLPHFYGHFIGNGKTISNLSANYPLTVDGGLGLFEVNSGTIENLNVTGRLGVSMEARVGMISGINYGTIKNCTSRSNVRRDMIFGIQGFSPDAQAGGIAGYNSGTVQDCTNYGGMISRNNVGGIVGYNDGQVIGSYNYGSIEGRNDTGGVVGKNSGTVSHSYNEGDVHGDNNNIGGIAGVNYGEIASSYNIGIVGGSINIGGIVGISAYGNVENTYNTGNVSGGKNIGGIAGRNEYSSVYNSYNTGNVSGSENIGGIVGGYSYSVDNCVSLGKNVSGTVDVVRVSVGGYLSNNKARTDMIVRASGISVQITSHPNGIHGESIPLNTSLSAVFSGWDTGVWYIPRGNLTVNGALPTLQDMPSQNPVLP